VVESQSELSVGAFDERESVFALAAGVDCLQGDIGSGAGKVSGIVAAELEVYNINHVGVVADEERIDVNVLVGGWVGRSGGFFGSWGGDGEGAEDSSKGGESELHVGG